MNTAKLNESIQQLQSRNIFFGHQSVGQNIIDGINDIVQPMPDNALQLIQLDNTFTPPVGKGYLIHSAVGENTQPVSKCEDFNRIIRSELSKTIDVAMLKFCYIDILENADVDALFEKYTSIMDNLIADYPDITFIHITTPLRHSESGLGIWIRELLGRPNRSKLANIKRNEFNQKLKSYYKDSPVFDLASSMSTDTDEKTNTFKYNGKQYRHLIGEYTSDGGHLNEVGRKKVAADFLKQVATLTVK